jgi:hypothetical protein
MRIEMADGAASFYRSSVPSGKSIGSSKLRCRPLLLAKELARRVMDEVQPGASRAWHRRVTVFLILWRVRQQVLHFQPGAGALEENGLGHPKSCQRSGSTKIPYHYLGVRTWVSDGFFSLSRSVLARVLAASNARLLSICAARYGLMA